MTLVRSLADLWTLARGRERWTAIGLVGLMLLASLAEISGMLVLFSYVAGLVETGATGRGAAFRHLIEEIAGTSETRFALVGGVAVVAVFLAKNLIATGSSFLNARFLMKLYERVAPRLFKAYLRAPYERFLKRGTAEPSRALSQMLGLFNAYFGSALQSVSDMVLAGTILALLLFVDPALTLLAAGLFGAALVLMHAATRGLLRRMGDENVANQRQSARTVAEAFQGLISSRLNGSTDRFVARFARSIQRAAMMSRRQSALAQLPRMSNELILAAGIVATAVYFTLRGEGIDAAVPTLALFGFAGLRLTAALSRVAQALQQIDVRRPEFRQLTHVVRDIAPELVAATPAAGPDANYLAGDRPLPDGAPREFADGLELRDVAFGYGDGREAALKGVSLTIRPKSFTGICGPSGSGKSTLLLVMMGLIRPERGSVTCDGWNVFDHLSSWHARIGYVGQRPLLPARPLREIVAFGRPPDEIDDERVWDALETARLADMVRRLPERLGTILGEDEVQASGGQIQRLDIARALYDDPDILFLDEATAALDNATEREIMDSIARISDRKTIICVAHRLTSIRDAGAIHVLEQGRVAASGSYDLLIRDATEFRKVAGAGLRG